MHILIVAGFIGKFGESDGVVTTYQNLIPRFAKAGIHLDVVAYGNEDCVEHYDNVRVITHKPRIPLQVDPARWIDAAVIQTKTMRDLAKIKYDLVQCSTPDTLGLWAIKVARRHLCPLVSIYHTALDHYAEIRLGKIFGNSGGKVAGQIVNRWLTWYFNQADMVLAPSHSIKYQLDDMIEPMVNVLMRGVNAEIFNPRFRTRNDNKVQALYVGRVAPEKNLKLLVDIFKNRSDVELKIVGDGPYLDEIREILPQATFTGRLSGKKLSEAYANGDFFVFPSKTDTLGNVVLEAMSSGIPAVVSNAMGPKELVDDNLNGFITSTDDEFESAVNGLIKDHNIRKKMGKSARKAAELKSWDNIFNQLCLYHMELFSLQSSFACYREM